MGTFAEGLATRTAFELPQRILRELLDDFVLVSRSGVRLRAARRRGAKAPEATRPGA
jgi:threonine dehydratase